MITGPALPSELDVDLAGLSAVAAQWFGRLPVSDQRIQAVPDGRTLRFYQSTGLIDRPVRYDGRVARYARRHLLQLLAVRALQSEGQSLAQIQTSLAGATDDELARRLALVLGGPRTTSRHAAHAVSSAPAAVLTSPAVAPSALVAAELAPGVVITIDARVHTDPARVIALLRRAIKGAQL
ncbi:MAG: MerR family transcriptional regulator [Gemmatimonadaceae bacterium]